MSEIHKAEHNIRWLKQEAEEQARGCKIVSREVYYIAKQKERINELADTFFLLVWCVILGLLIGVTL